VLCLCKIVPSNNADTQSRLNAFNSLIPALVSNYVAADKKVILVDMASALDNNDLKDTLHLNDQGYWRMAATYYNAITLASVRKWISKAGPITLPNPCMADLNVWSSPASIAAGPSM
jgi:hypothetical protein